MIYAIPNKHNCVSNHFMKAQQFAFISDENSQVQNIVNPGFGGKSSCKDKKEALNLISKMNADAVIVRNIGERSLGKLLTAGIRVFRVSGQTSIDTALQSPMVELTSAEQGRPSVNHTRKGGCGGHSAGGCGGHHGESSGCGCGGHHAHGHEHKAMAMASHGHGKGKGQARIGRVNAILSSGPLNK